MPQLRGSEWLIIILLVVLLFGAKRMPDAARSMGRSLRIFKAETKGLRDDDEDDKLTPEQREINARNRAAERRAEELREAEQRVAELRGEHDGNRGPRGTGTDEPGAPLR